MAGGPLRERAAPALQPAVSGRTDAPAAPSAPSRELSAREPPSAEQPLAGAFATMRGAPLETCSGTGDVLREEIVMVPRRPPLTAAISLPAADIVLPSPQSLACMLPRQAPLRPTLNCQAPVQVVAEAEADPLYRRSSAGMAGSAETRDALGASLGLPPRASPDRLALGLTGMRTAAEQITPAARQRTLEQQADPGIGAPLCQPTPCAAFLHVALHAGLVVWLFSLVTQSHVFCKLWTR